FFFFFSSRRRHTRFSRDWSSDVCSSDLPNLIYPNQKVYIPDLSAQKGVESEVLRLTNIERAKVGAPALKMDWELQRVARIKSEDMRDRKYFSHQSPTYGSPFNMMKAFRIYYRSASENIEAGQ